MSGVELRAPDSVSIILLNLNKWEETLDCIASILSIDYENLSLVILDNGSQDESVLKFLKYFEKRGIPLDEETKQIGMAERLGGIYRIFSNLGTHPEAISNAKKNENIGRMKVSIIRSRLNLGFAEGNNVGLRYSKFRIEPDYFLLLNNDTNVEPDLINGLLRVARIDEKIGVVGPKIFDWDGQTVQSMGVLVDFWTGNQRSIKNIRNGCDNKVESIEVDYVSGCALFFKSKIIDEIGYLNSNYFAYWEDTDWCMRAKMAGYRIVIAPSAKIKHKKGMTSGRKTRLFYYLMTRNYFWCFREHSKPFQYLIHIICYSIFRLWIWLIISYKNAGYEGLKGSISGLKDGIYTQYDDFRS